MLSKPLAAVQSTTSISGVSGKGAVSSPSLIGRCSVGTGRVGRSPGAGSFDVDPATLAGAARDRLADEHLVVAVGEGRVAGREEGRPATTSA